MAITEIADPKSWETDVLNSEKPSICGLLGTMV